MKKNVAQWLLLAVWLTSCTVTPDAVVDETILPSNMVTLISRTEPSPAMTIAPLVPSPVLVTPSPQLPAATHWSMDPDPLQIEVMRQQAYPGSPITFEQTLSPGANYNRDKKILFEDGCTSSNPQRGSEG
jgi:hypothetical protein